MRHILGIDIGGSSIKSALVNVRTGQLARPRFVIPISSPCAARNVVMAVRRVHRHFAWSGPVGIGFPAMMRDGIIGTAGNLGDHWEGTDGPRLFGRVSSPDKFHLINDADAAGLAEMRFGAGRGESGLVLIVTLGTGIGSALFYRGKLAPKVELGHIPFRGQAIERYAAAAVQAREKLTWPAWGRRLSRFLAIAERLCAPDLIILGGGISRQSQLWLPHVKARTRLLPASLGNDAGLIGAALAWAEIRAR
jgi:polyphosphate glucokinase